MTAVSPQIGPTVPKAVAAASTPRRDPLGLLLERARQGDRDAQAQLLGGIQDTCYRFCCSQLGDGDAARDATQETALRLLQSLHRYQQRSAWDTWVLGIALNVCRQHRRQRRRRPAPLPDHHAELVDGGTEGPAARLRQREAIELVRQALCDLAPRQRQAVVLRFFERQSLEQTAQAMGCAVGTVKAAVAQALTRLRQRWSDEP